MWRSHQEVVTYKAIMLHYQLIMRHKVSDHKTLHNMVIPLFMHYTQLVSTMGHVLLAMVTDYKLLANNFVDTYCINWCEMWQVTFI